MRTDARRLGWALAALCLLLPAGAVTGVTLTAVPASPQPVGTAITLAAAATGGSGSVEYSFRLRYITATGATVNALLRNYSTAATQIWVPTSTGIYTLYAGARDVGSTASYQALATLSYTVTGAVAPTPAPTGRIAFISNRDGNDEVYSMKADGTAQTRITSTPAVELEPAWSADGTRLAFASKRTGSYELFSVNADGTGVTQLTKNGQADWGPSYAGTTLYFFRTVSGADEIYRMAATGGNEVRLTTNTWFDVLPVLTPNGKKIIFDSDRNGATRQANYDLYSMNPDGTGQTRLTTNAGQDWYHAVSPDGTTIAYQCDDHINLMNVDGSNIRRLTSPAGYRDARPTFSPDGRYLAFATNRDGNWEIYRMKIDGTGVTRLTNNTWNDTAPAWGAK